MMQPATVVADRVTERELSDEEAQAAFGESPMAKMEGALEAAPEEGLPDWVLVPPGFAIPPGRRVFCMRFRAEWTDAPQKGDRVMVLWSLTEAEEKLAYKRSGDDTRSTIAELSKQSIRAIDGCKADWTRASVPGAVHILWNDLGTRCRQQIMNWYLKSHTLTSEQQQDFFVNCFAVRSAVGG